MKKVLILVLALVMVVALVACQPKATESTEAETKSETTSETKSEAPSGTLQDGTYFATADTFSDSGWKGTVTLSVKGGKITTADWNGIHKNAGVDKKTFSKEGKYGMKEKGKAQAEWHEQAEKVENYLIETQDPTKIQYKDKEGHTDAISGVSIHVNEFFELAAKALTQAPVEKGPYKDGAHHAEAKEFVNGWKDTVDLTVMHGKIVAANWDGISEKDAELTKKKASSEGSYGMKEKGKAQSEWHEQAAAAEAHLLEIQDPTKISYTDNEGHTDAISGVSIHVNGFFDLAKEALGL